MQATCKVANLHTRTFILGCVIFQPPRDAQISLDASRLDDAPQQRHMDSVCLTEAWIWGHPSVWRIGVGHLYVSSNQPIVSFGSNSVVQASTPPPQQHRQKAIRAVHRRRKPCDRSQRSQRTDVSAKQQVICAKPHQDGEPKQGSLFRGINTALPQTRTILSKTRASIVSVGLRSEAQCRGCLSIMQRPEDWMPTLGVGVKSILIRSRPDV